MPQLPAISAAGKPHRETAAHLDLSGDEQNAMRLRSDSNGLGRGKRLIFKQKKRKVLMDYSVECAIILNNNEMAPAYRILNTAIMQVLFRERLFSFAG